MVSCDNNIPLDETIDSIDVANTIDRNIGNDNVNNSSNIDLFNGKKLVIYFSVPETTNPDNMSDEEDYSTYVRNGEVLGNVQYVAYLISENTGADLYRIEPTIPYPMNHDELENVARKEKKENALPDIKVEIQDLNDYNVVFIGYPNWYGDMPRIIYFLIEKYDFSGKTIIPFVVSGGSGFSNSINTIIKSEPNANVIKNGYSIVRTNMESAENGVKLCLNQLGF